MELTRGQQEYLLELLSHEYVIPEVYVESLKHAIRRYATADYTDEELDFLLRTSQSLAADMMRSTTDSLPSFAKYFALWANCLEYNIFEGNALAEAIVINPDPTSREKLFQIINSGGQYQVIAVPEIRFMAQPRAIETLPSVHNTERRLKPTPTVSVWSFRTLEKLLAGFLSYAQQTDGSFHKPDARACQEAYTADLASNLARSRANQFTWQELRQMALQLPLIESTYVFTGRDTGLIIPSNIDFISYLNQAQPAKNPAPKSQRIESPFAFLDQFAHYLHPNHLKNMALRPPKLPFYFGKYAQKPYHLTKADMISASCAQPNNSHCSAPTKMTGSKMHTPCKHHSTNASNSVGQNMLHPTNKCYSTNSYVPKCHTQAPNVPPLPTPPCCNRRTVSKKKPHNIPPMHF